MECPSARKGKQCFFSGGRRRENSHRIPPIPLSLSIPPPPDESLGPPKILRPPPPYTHKRPSFDHPIDGEQTGFGDPGRWSFSLILSAEVSSLRSPRFCLQCRPPSPPSAFAITNELQPLRCVRFTAKKRRKRRRMHNLICPSFRIVPFLPPFSAQRQGGSRPHDQGKKPGALHVSLYCAALAVHASGRGSGGRVDWCAQIL